MTGSERPVCDYCERPIKERYYFQINGDVICRQCLFDNFEQELNEDLVEEDEYEDEGEYE